MNDPKVAFFVDDDDDFLRLVDMAIQHPRFQIKTMHVDNGYQAIDEIIKTKPDVLFIDFCLPRVNAGQILPIIKYIHSLSDLPIYLVTNFSKDEISPFLTEVNPDGVLLKNNSFPDEVLKILKGLDVAA